MIAFLLFYIGIPHWVSHFYGINAGSLVAMFFGFGVILYCFLTRKPRQSGRQKG